MCIIIYVIKIYHHEMIITIYIYTQECIIMHQKYIMSDNMWITAIQILVDF